MTKDNYSGKFAEFYKKYKRMPSYAEIMELFGYRSKNAAFKLVNKLVEAGVVHTRNLDDWLVTSRDSTYLLQVRGDSMIEAGIMNGDTVIADRSRPAKNGDIVIAEVDGGWTMKYLKKTGSKVELLPANKNYKPIIPRHDLNIAAVVTSVIRKY